MSDMKSSDETPSATQITDRNGYVTSVKAYREEIVYGYKKIFPIFISGKIPHGKESGLYPTKDEVAKFLDENEILSDQ